MKITTKICISAITLIILIGISQLQKGFFSNDLALYSIFIQIIDEDTAEPINVEIYPPKTEFENYLNLTSNKSQTFSFTEMEGNKIRISWIDLNKTVHKIKLSSEGYGEIFIPDKYIYKTTGLSNISGFRNPDIIKVSKTQK